MITNSYQFFSKCDNEHLMELLNDRIQTIHGVNGTETLISLDSSIDREIPINYE